MANGVHGDSVSRNVVMAFNIASDTWRITIQWTNNATKFRTIHEIVILIAKKNKPRVSHVHSSTPYLVHVSIFPLCFFSSSMRKEPSSNSDDQCPLSEWTEYTACTQTCGEEYQTRTRMFTKNKKKCKVRICRSFSLSHSSVIEHNTLDLLNCRHGIRISNWRADDHVSIRLASATSRRYKHILWMFISGLNFTYYLNLISNCHFSHWKLRISFVTHTHKFIYFIEIKGIILHIQGYLIGFNVFCFLSSLLGSHENGNEMRDQIESQSEFPLLDCTQFKNIACTTECDAPCGVGRCMRPRIPVNEGCGQLEDEEVTCNEEPCRIPSEFLTWIPCAQRIWRKQNAILNSRILLSIAENRSANLHRSQGSRQQVLLQYGCTAMRSIYHELWAGRKRIRIDSGVFDQLHRSHRIRSRAARSARDAIEVIQLAACKRMCLIRIWLLNFVLNMLTIFETIANFKILIEPVVWTDCKLQCIKIKTDRIYFIEQ